MRKAINFARNHAAPWTPITETQKSVNFKVYDLAEANLADKFAFANHIGCTIKQENGLYSKRMSVTFAW